MLISQQEVFLLPSNNSVFMLSHDTAQINLSSLLKIIISFCLFIDSTISYNRYIQDDWIRYAIQTSATLLHARSNLGTMFPGKHDGNFWWGKKTKTPWTKGREDRGTATDVFFLCQGRNFYVPCHLQFWSKGNSTVTHRLLLQSIELVGVWATIQLEAGKPCCFLPISSHRILSLSA